jgi:hypothetical protein
MRRFFPVLFLFLFTGTSLLSAKEYYLEQYDYYVNIPETWNVQDASDPNFIVFSDSGRQAVFQILAVSPQSGDETPKSVFRRTADSIGASLEQATFSCNGRDASFGEFRFTMNATGVRGYGICIKGKDIFFMLMAYAPEKSYDRYQADILSCLDSFSLGGEALVTPGPVSQFYYPFPGPNQQLYQIVFQGDVLKIHTDEDEVEASQIVIEREAAILSRFKQPNQKAWQRYYRIIYRDSYSRLASLADMINLYFTKEHREMDDYTIAVHLLDWLQSFSYIRTGTLSDLQAPLQSVLTSSGDCDSLGLLYCTLLDYFGIDSIMLVSAEYGHSMAAVDVAGKGARYEYENRSYLLAELTDDVDIGLVDRTMADPAKWLPIDLER